MTELGEKGSSSVLLAAGDRGRAVNSPATALFLPVLQSRIPKLYSTLQVTSLLTPLPLLELKSETLGGETKEDRGYELWKGQRLPSYTVVTQEISTSKFTEFPEPVRQNGSVQLCATRQLR